MQSEQERTNVLEQTVAQQSARIEELETLVRYYEEQFRLQKHRQYGSSSEKGVPAEQLGLFDEAENTADQSLSEPTLEEISYTRRKKRVGKREEDISRLPLEIVRHSLSEEECICPECGNQMHEMGHEIARRELKVIPAQVVAVEYQRSAYACRKCEKTNDHVPMIKASIPEPVIKGSLASPSAIAHIMVQKYVMHAPLYRQEKDWERQGVALSRQTMANWIIRAADDWLTPLYERMHTLLRKQEILHADETGLQVLHEPGKPATSRSYMWLYRTSGDTKRHIILFEYQPNRSHLHPKQFLGDFNGLLHADGYAGYHKLEPGVKIIGCWTHLRRKWHDALKVIPAEQRAESVAQQAIDKIGYLFHLEEIWKRLEPEERYRRRQEESKPLAEAFFAWCKGLRVLPQSAIGKAVHYALQQKPWLMNVYLDGRTELSNNRIENSVRPFALGRKNWLFCNTVNGAKASSIVYSLIETAMANGLKPFEYLEFLFETLPNTTSSSMDSLLPWGEAVPSHCKMSVLEVANRA